MPGTVPGRKVGMIEVMILVMLRHTWAPIWMVKTLWSRRIFFVENNNSSKCFVGTKSSQLDMRVMFERWTVGREHLQWTHHTCWGPSVSQMMNPRIIGWFEDWAIGVHWQTFRVVSSMYCTLQEEWICVYVLANCRYLLISPKVFLLRLLRYWQQYRGSVRGQW